MATDRNDELLPLFLDEAGERLERLFELAQQVGEDPEAAAATRRDLHALKGASRMMGLGGLSGLCHRAEDLVDAAAAGDPRALQACFEEIAQQLETLSLELAPTVGEGASDSDVNPSAVERHRSRRDEMRVQTRVVDELADRGARLRVLAAGAGGLADRIMRLAALAELGARDDEPRQVLATLATSLRQAALELETGQRILCRLTDRQLEVLLHLQVQSLRPFLQTLADHARELGTALGKKIEVSVDAGESELDRRIINALNEAFLHLVRNAVDHGVETPAERRAAGKPEVAVIRLQAFTEGDRVRLQLADDGRGIDPERVLRAAVARGLVDADRITAFDTSEALQLLMQPGFSTRDTTSEVSGRGIGLDAVATAVRAVGGDVWLDSSRHEGTVVTVEVPVARRGERVLILRVGGHVVVMPAAPVQAFRSLRSSDVHEIDGRFVVRLRGRSVEPSLLPELGGRPGADGMLLEMVVGGTVVAVIVDDVVGEEEVIVRPIPAAAGAPRVVEGMALLASGRPVAVLSPRQLAPVTGSEVLAEAAGDGRVRPIRVLLVDDSDLTREMLRRLLEDGGFDVVDAASAEEAVLELERADIDCLVTDIEMPGMSGLDLTRKLRGDPRFADLPVIVVSTLDRPVDRLDGLEAGADAYLTKQGLDARELVGLVARVGGGG